MILADHETANIKTVFIPLSSLNEPLIMVETFGQAEDKKANCYKSEKIHKYIHKQNSLYKLTTEDVIHVHKK